MSKHYKPLVSVVVPTYNQGELLKKTIQSVLDQTYTNIEIVVVDDGSSDNTRDVVEEFVSMSGNKVIYKQQKNQGTPAARNFGWRSARGELIATLDHDDLWLPQKLQRQVPIFEDSSVGMSHAAVHFFFEENGEKIITSTGYAGSEWNPEQAASFSQLDTITYVPPIEVDVHDLLARTVLCTQTFLFRRTALENLDGFDEDLKGTDDWDICIRMADRYKIVGVPQILALARHHPSQQSSNYRHMFENEMKLIHKNRKLHSNCQECLEASAKAESLSREACYKEVKVAIKRNLSKKKFLQALLLVPEAFKVNPVALRRITKRLLQYSASRLFSRFATNAK